VLPHQLAEKLNDLAEGYELLRKEFPSPQILLSDLTKLHRLISQMENRYGSVDNFLKEIEKIRKELQSVSLAGK